MRLLRVGYGALALLGQRRTRLDGLPDLSQDDRGRRSWSPRRACCAEQPAHQVAGSLCLAVPPAQSGAPRGLLAQASRHGWGAL